MAETQKPPRTEAEIEADVAKTRAEVEKTLAEARKAAAEAAKAEYEAEYAREEAEQAKIASRKVRLQWERDKEKRDRELAENVYHHVYSFEGQVSESSVQKCIAELTYWHRSAPECPIEVVFFSPGGSVIDGMALWDYLGQLKGCGHKLTTGCVGYAASMAGILLQAGDVRWMGRESYVLIHEAAFMVGGKLGEVEDHVEWVHKIQDRVLDIFAARSTLSKAQIKRRWRRKDWWLDSAEALKLGFVDEVR